MIITLGSYFFLGEPSFGVVLGVIAGMYLIRPETVKMGALYGALIALPLALYINLAALFSGTSPAGSVSASLLNTLLHVLLSALVGALYGSVFVWLTNRMTRGRNPQS